METTESKKKPKTRLKISIKIFWILCQFFPVIFFGGICPATLNSTAQKTGHDTVLSSIWIFLILCVVATAFLIAETYEFIGWAKNCPICGRVHFTGWWCRKCDKKIKNLNDKNIAKWLNAPYNDAGVKRAIRFTQAKILFRNVKPPVIIRHPYPLPNGIIKRKER